MQRAGDVASAPTLKYTPPFVGVQFENGRLRLAAAGITGKLLFIIAFAPLRQHREFV